MEQERRFALLPLIQDLLPVIDNLDRALQSAPQNEANAAVVAGVKMVADQFRAALERHHCQPIEALGAPFDPHFHQAISRQATKDHPPGTVLYVAQSGWRLYDRVVRPAQVIVAAEPEEG
jgi:molecular chaperone GrpE